MADELYEARKVIEEYRKMLDQYSEGAIDSFKK